MGDSILDALNARRDEAQAELDAILDKVAEEKRTALTEEEDSKFQVLADEIRGIDTRSAELTDLAKRQADAAAARAAAGAVGGATVTDAPVYRRNDPTGSYFRDLYMARMKGDSEAADRLRRCALQTRDEIAKLGEPELRALGNTGAAGGSGGEFAPPLWLVSDFVALARPGRKFADSLNPMPLPHGVSSVNLPKVTGGTSTAIQTTQNTALSQTDMTTGSVSSGISTIGGKQVVSMQLLEQSGIPFDQVVLSDLAKDYARQFDTQVLAGSGTGGQLEGVYTYFTASGSVNTAYSQATPAVGGKGGFYATLFAAAAAIEGARFVPPDTVWMHPRRWNWVLAASDSSNRPLVVPQGAAYNPIGSADQAVAEGAVGQIGGLAVITDANIPTTTGTGTNQDPVLVGVRSDLRLWESALRLETFTEPYADSAGVLFRALAYSAAIPSRYASSVSVVNGVGLVPPSF